MSILTRRQFLKKLAVATVSSTVFSLQGCRSLHFWKKDAKINRPNIIFCMADDMGWGDPGFNGNTIIKTPNLDAMAAAGLKFNRFYAAAPVGSPTRASCLTGRHPYRYGILYANVGHMRKEEITLAEALKTVGYTTGHFGKWYLGTMLPDYSARGDERNPKLNYATPAMNGFDEWFSTENAVATWDPYDPENIPGRDGKYEKRSLYWHNGQNVTEELKGCDSGIIMDRAISFIENAAQNNRPFLAAIWFHAPHAPVIAGPKYRQMYADYDHGRQHYFGCITALDEQIGRLRTELGRLGIANDTMLWFCSDNGPEGKTGDLGRFRGSTGPFRGRKRSLFEGGLRVPALVEWPARIKPGRLSDVPCCTSDYYPTVMEILQFQMPNQPRPIDGISLAPLIDGKMKSRPVPIAFESRKQSCLTDNRYKLISIDDGSHYMLFDLIKDPAETRDIADENPKIVRKMKTALKRWHKNCKNSLAGEDY